MGAASPDRPKPSGRLPDEVTAARVLSHPLRRLLLDALHANGPQSASMLAGRVESDVRTVSHHLRTLERARFVEHLESVRRGNVVEHFYRGVVQARIEIWIPSGGSAR